MSTLNLQWRSALRRATFIFAIVAFGWLAVTSHATETNALPTSTVGESVTGTNAGEVFLQKLLEGNARFVKGESQHPDQTTERRAALAGGQNPFAIVLTCSDSRVSPELFFDQGLGDLFVIRNAGNLLDDHVVGSIEYAVEHLHVPLIVVVGHEKCGAVSAAVAGGTVPGHIHSITDDLAPVIEQTRSAPGDKVENAVIANARRNAEILSHIQPFIAEAVKAHKLLIVSARYDLKTGAVEILK